MTVLGHAVCGQRWPDCFFMQGLMLFPAVVIVPLLEILWVLFIMVSGGIYFGDFEAFSRLQLIMFGAGVFVLLVGMFCLMPQKSAAGMHPLGRILLLASG